MENLKQTIADNLAFLRKKSGLTQLELAQKLNYSDKSISKWEHAETLPDVEILHKLASLYNVSLDYITSDAPKEEKEKLFKKNQNKQNQIIITFLAISFVWILATVIFVYSNFTGADKYWLIYIWAIPISFIITLYFNKIWGKRKYSFYLMSALLWSLLLSFYLQFLPYNMFLIFLVGLPVQIAIILWSQIKV